MTGGTPEIAVVVPTFNRRWMLERVLDCLRAQTLDPRRFEIAVVDDCSTDGTWELLEKLSRAESCNVRAIRTDVNSGGPAVPRNVGWRSSTAPILAFTDDDCQPDPTWLEAGLAAMSGHPSWGVVQGRTVAPPGTDLTRLDEWSIWRANSGPTPWFEAANIFYRHSALEATKGFNEEFGSWGEDTELGWSVLAAGWDRGYTDDAVVCHETDIRGWRHAARFAWRDKNLIRVAAAHPQFRQEAFWRPWAIHRRSAEFALAVAGAAASLVWSPAIALALPYVWIRRPPVKEPGFLTRCARIAAVDTARLAGDIVGSMSNGILVL
jgi:GT2 family glycosyltransferase